QLEIAAEDLPRLVFVIVTVDEELVLQAELRREELVDERDVVVEPADLEDLLPAQAEFEVPALLLRQRIALLPFLAEAPLVPPILDVAEELEAELVGIESAGTHGDGAGMAVGVVDELGGVEGAGGHDGGVPVARPALVHDLRLALGREVVGLLPDDGEDLLLPRFERRVFEQKEEDVPLRPLGEAFALRLRLLPLPPEPLQVLRRVDVGLHVLAL